MRLQFLKPIPGQETRATGLLILALLLVTASPAPGLPPPEDMPEEVLRTEIFPQARSPVDGELLTAAEYAELQVALRSTAAVEPKVAPKIRRLITLLRLRKGIRSIFPFLLR